MKRILFMMGAVTAVVATVDSSSPESGHTDEAASPIYGVTIPPGYRDWKMIAVAQLKSDKVDQLRATRQRDSDQSIKGREDTVPGRLNHCRAALDSCRVGRQR